MLPVDAVIPQIVDSLKTNLNLVVEAPPGAGKTTRVPPALLTFGGVVVLEPRRLAVRLAFSVMVQADLNLFGNHEAFRRRADEYVWQLVWATNQFVPIAQATTQLDCNSPPEVWECCCDPTELWLSNLCHDGFFSSLDCCAAASL